MTTARLVFNFVAFQAAWFAAVGGAAAGHDWAGPAATAVVAAVHLATAPQPRRELGVLLAVGALGTVWDSVLVALGVVEYRGAALGPGLAPVWIATLWIAFATTLSGSLRWLQGRRWLAALLGAVFGPLAYAAGESMGAVRLPALTALAVEAAGWAVLLPLACAIAARASDPGSLEARRV